MATYIPEDKITEIKNSADIVDVVSEAVLLKKTGKNYVGLCPFHSEKTPSFTVSPEKQIFYCFGCTEGGNVISFLMKHGGISFPDAARSLARRYGIDLPTQMMSPEQKRRIGERERLLEINRHAMDFFRKGLLDSHSGKQAMTYLQKRGIKDDIVNRFNIGYAPEGWDNLSNYFSKRSIPLALVEKAGLIVSKKNKQGFYDRFRDRIIFPIIDASMQVIGFGGRIMDDSMPKYLNSPETPVYNKRRSLYGIHRAKNKCRESETVYIVEGYFDLLALHQHGIENSVATLGTALTVEHVRVLKGNASRVILVYDSDDAGIKAVLRSIGIFMEAAVDARITVLPEGYDPDSYIIEFGHESFINAVSKARSIMSFLIDSAVKKHGRSIEGKIRIISELKGALASINDSVARSLYVKELAERIGIEEATVLEKVREVSARNIDRGQTSARSKSNIGRGLPRLGGQDKINGKGYQGKWVKLERQIVSMMLQSPQILSEIDKRNILDFFEDNDLKAIGQLVLSRKDIPNIKISDIINLIEDKQRWNIAARLAIGDSKWNHEDCLNVIDRFESIRKRDESTLIDKIKEAEKNDDLDRLKELLNKKQKMAVLSEKQKMARLR